MLDMMTDYMEGIYNLHSEVNPVDMLQSFRNKYSEHIDNARRDCVLPRLDHMDLFHLFQQKSVTKSGGLDGWSVKELHQLPPVGWIGFTFVMRLAEAVGEWPQTIKCISVSSIAKHDRVSSPEDMRAIGVSSLVYSTYSSLRFKQLAGWLHQVCPHNLLGGLKGRSADVSEYELSLEIHDPSSPLDVVGVFIDRWKCFDLVIPEVSLGVARFLAFLYLFILPL